MTKFILIFLGLIINVHAVSKDLASTEVKNYTVKMLDKGIINPKDVMVFEPTYLAIKKKDSLSILAVDKGHGSQSVSVPKGAKSWKSGMNKSIDLKFDIEGYYLYVCKPHTRMGMVGLLKVGQEVTDQNKQQTLKSLMKLKKRSRINKKRVQNLINFVETNQKKY